MVRDQLCGCYWIFEENIFHKGDAVPFAAGGIRESPAAETHSKNRAVNHSWRHLKIVLVGDGIVSIINTFGQEAGNELHFHTV